MPGNHDVPLYDLLRRVFSPLGRFRRYISSDPAPLVVLPGVRVLGLDSTRRKVVGRLRADRLPPVGRLLEGPPDDLRILVTHHPLVRQPLDGAREALAAAARAHAHLVRAGHHHHFHVTETPQVLAVEAGSALSHRAARQCFNVVRAAGRDLEVTPWTWDGAAFICGDTRRFVRREHALVER